MADESYTKTTRTVTRTVYGGDTLWQPPVMTDDLQKEIEASVKDFDKWDKDNNGKLTVREFKEIRPTGGHHDHVFKIVDRDHDGHVTKEEYVKYRTMAKMHEDLEPHFTALDTNKNGFIDRRELHNLLTRRGFDSHRANRLFDELDTNNDGRISYREFSHNFHKL